jgi:PD-(D/E)XK nuclease superfamily
MTTPYPIVERYKYPKFKAVTYKTGRLYLTPDGDEVPSVTTILSLLPKDGIKAWRERIGEEEADRITEEACRIGTTMHDRLEGYVSNYLQGRPDIPPETDEDREAYEMSDNIRRFALPDLDEVWGIEEALYCTGLYAGRTDLIGVYLGKTSVIDYKSTRRWKKPEWLNSYKMQLAAYNFCHKAMFGEGLEQGVILLAVRPPYTRPLQRVLLTKDELEHWEEKWLDLLEKYHREGIQVERKM